MHTFGALVFGLHDFHTGRNWTARREFHLRHRLPDRGARRRTIACQLLLPSDRHRRRHAAVQRLANDDMNDSTTERSIDAIHRDRHHAPSENFIPNVQLPRLAASEVF